VVHFDVLDYRAKGGVVQQCFADGAEEVDVQVIGEHWGFWHYLQYIVLNGGPG
jgi:hypothetical protein